MSWLGKLFGGKGAEGGQGGGGAGTAIAGVRLVIDRRDYGVADLGVRTFRISPYQGELIATQNFQFTMILSLDKEEYKFPGVGIVKEITDSQGLTAQFKSPQPFFDRKLMEFLANHRTQHPKSASPPASQPQSSAHSQSPGRKG